MLEFVELGFRIMLGFKSLFRVRFKVEVILYSCAGCFDEPMVHQNINLDAFTVCVERNIMKEGIFNLGGLSSSLIFKGAEFFRKEEKEKAREYVNIGSMHVEIPRVFPT